MGSYGTNWGYVAHYGVIRAMVWTMEVTAPYTVVVPKTDGKVLTVLAGTTRPLSGREIARLAGLSQNGAWRVLKRLSAHGLLIEQEAGSGAALLYTLNRYHVAAKPILDLLQLRRTLFNQIGDAVNSWKIEPVHASVFGSAARGDGDLESDIDICLVRPSTVNEEDPVWRSQLNDLAEAVHAWSGNHAGIAEIPQQELRRLKRVVPPVVADLQRDAVLIAGKSVKEILGG